MKKEISKSIHVHQVQFEKEFEVYNPIWKKLVKLKNVTYRLRPEGELINTEESDEERKNRKILAFKKAYKDCWIVFENNKPFYPPKIYKAIDAIFLTLRKELIQYRFDDDRTNEYWLNGLNNYQDISDKIDMVCNEIQMQIGLMSVKT